MLRYSDFMKTFHGTSERVDEEEDHEYYIQLCIHHAEGIDKATMVPNSDQRLYRVYAWILPECSEDYFTQVVFGLPNPCWNWACDIPMRTYEPYKYMHLEICRTWSKSDPGTSNGRILIGRTKIPLPTPGCKEAGRYELVMPYGLGCIAEGHIVVSMRAPPVKPVIYYN